MLAEVVVMIPLLLILPSVGKLVVWTRERERDKMIVGVSEQGRSLISRRMSRYGTEWNQECKTFSQ